MSYASKILALPGLVGYWPLTDAAGATTAADAGPNNLPLTVGGSAGSAAVFGGASSPPAGLASYVSLDGSVASPLTRAAASGSLLDLSTGLTLGGWVRINTAPASGTPDFAGRSGSFYTLRMMSGANAGKFRALVNANGALASGEPATTDQTFGITGSWFFVALTWSQEQGEARLYVNGVLDTVYYRPGAINAGTNAFTLGPLSVAAMAVDLAGWFVCNKALGAAHLRDAYEDAGAPSTTFPKFADAGRTGTGTPSLGVAGGHIDAQDGQVTSGQGTWRPDLYQLAAGGTAAAFPAAGNASVLVPKLARKLIGESTVRYTQRADPGDTQYHDGTKFVYSGSSITFGFSSTAIIAGLATAHRAARATAHRSWMVEQAKTIANYLIASQQPSGQFFDTTSADTGITFAAFAWAAVMLRDALDRPTLAAWVNSIVKCAGYWTAAAQKAWYVNGNIEMQVAEGLYATYLLTNDPFWKGEFDLQWAKVMAPGAGVASLAGPANAHGYGLTYTVNPTAADGSDGKAYLAERGSSGDAGLDWGYLGTLQVMSVQRLHVLSGDPAHLRLLNLLVNKALERLDTGTFSYNATGGTRQNVTYTALQHGLTAYLQWRGYRPDLTLALETHWLKAKGDIRTNGFFANENYWRMVGFEIAGWVIAAADFPGVPSP